MAISCCEMVDFPHRKNSKHSKIDIKVKRMVVCTSSLHKKYFTQITNRTANNLYIHPLHYKTIYGYIVTRERK